MSGDLPEDGEEGEGWESSRRTINIHVQPQIYASHTAHGKQMYALYAAHCEGLYALYTAQ